MGVMEWVAICGTITLAILLGTLVWRLASRIGTVEGLASAASTRADVAGINVAANSLKVEKVASELAAHREAVAKDYVSTAHMVQLENRLVDAVGKLGDRIDALFTRSVGQH